MAEGLTIEDLVTLAMTERFDAALADDGIASAVVTKVVVVAEILASDGERYLQHLRPTGQPLWDCLGMAHAALAEWTAQLTAQGDDSDG